jgi:hypothetical protein
VSVVHRIECPSVCSYATFAHRLRFLFLVCGFWFLVSGLWFLVLSPLSNQKPETMNQKL